MEYYKIPFSALSFLKEKGEEQERTHDRNAEVSFSRVGNRDNIKQRSSARNFEKCSSLEQSIADNIQLIITTSFGECGYDETFGCSIWENDFENIMSNDQWKERLAKSIKKSIEVHEPRLTSVLVRTDIIQDEIKTEQHNTIINRIKRRIDIIVNAKIILTDLPFSGSQQVYISPIALD